MGDGLDDIRETIAERVRAVESSPAAISKRATGKPDMIRKFVDEGVTPRSDRLRALCNELGLEFYVGPPRDPGRANNEPGQPNTEIIRAIETSVRQVLPGIMRELSEDQAAGLLPNTITEPMGALESTSRPRQKQMVVRLLELKQMARRIRLEAAAEGDQLSVDEILAEMREAMRSDEELGDSCGAGSN